MNEKEEKQVVQQEVYQAIAYFIERQHLVAQAMQDLGLDLEEVGKWATVAWFSGQGTDKPRLEEDASDEGRELFEVMKRAIARNLSSTGSWGDTGEWTYFLHGQGCMLRNAHTGEIINWNCPNVLAFDPYFFLDHLKWRLGSHHREDELQYTRAWIQQQPEGFRSILSLIEEMINDGLINKDMTLLTIDQ